MTANPILALLFYCFIILASIVSMFFLIRILKKIWNIERKDRLKFSFILKYYFYVLFVMCILLIIHSTTVLCIWRSDMDLLILPMFWTGVIDGNFMIAVPLTSCVLTLDKCLILLLKGKYSDKLTIRLFRASVLINMIIAGANFVVSVLFHQSEQIENCVSYGCTLLSSAQLTYTYTRTVTAMLTTIVGISFIIIKSWFKKKKPEIATKMKSIVEAVISTTIVFGILCDFLPHITDTLLISTTGDTLFMYIGPYSRLIMALYLLLSSGMNLLVFTKSRNKKAMTEVQIITTTKSY